MEKRLYRSKRERKICGVCGGIAEYFNIDPTLVRLAVAGLCLFTGSGIIAYIVGAIIIPEEDYIVESGNYSAEENIPEEDNPNVY